MRGDLIDDYYTRKKDRIEVEAHVKMCSPPPPPDPRDALLRECLGYVDVCGDAEECEEALLDDDPEWHASARDLAARIRARLGEKP